MVWEVLGFVVFFGDIEALIDSFGVFKLYNFLWFDFNKKYLGFLHEGAMAISGSCGDYGLFWLCVMSIGCSMCSFDVYELKSWLDVVMDAWMVWFLFMLVLGYIQVIGGFELSYMLLISSMMVWLVLKAYV